MRTLCNRIVLHALAGFAVAAVFVADVPRVEAGRGGGLTDMIDPSAGCKARWPGSFLDAGRWECWKCPASHPHRTIFPVHGQQACERGAHRVKAMGPRAPFGLLKTDCARGWFLDLGRGKCYKCPKGYRRTIFAVDSNSACERPGGPSRTRAIYMGSAP